VVKYHEKTFYRIINYVVKGLNVTTQLDILQSSICKNVRWRRGQKRISASRTTREVFVIRDPTRGERKSMTTRECNSRVYAEPEIAGNIGTGSLQFLRGALV